MSTPVSALPRAAAGGGLQLSDRLYLAGIGAAAAVMVDPLHLHLVHGGATRHLALLITLPAVVLTVAGRRLAEPRAGDPRLRAVLRAAWPLLLLALIIAGGSLYARRELGIYDTFLNVGAYMLMVPAAAAMVTHARDPDALVQAIAAIVAAAAGVMAALLVYYYGRRHVYHDQIFLVIPVAVGWFMVVRRRAVAWTGAAALLATAVFSAKNTSYLMALMIACYIVAVAGLPRLRRLRGPQGALAAYLAVVALALVGAAALYLFLHRDQYLPSGNVTYRSHTYAAAWRRFLSSPLAGDLFTASSVRKFNLYTIDIAGGRLPTHSDILDLLANGGLAGIGLWALGLARIGRIAWRRLLAPRHTAHPWAGYGHGLAAVSLGAVLTYAFNPVLLDPAMSYLVWTCAGTLLGLALRAPEAPPRAASGSSP